MADPLQQARKEAAGWLILLEDDPEDHEQRALFEQWLAADPNHAMVWDSIGHTSDLLAAAPPPKPATRFRMGRVSWAGLAMAAMVVMAVTPGLLLRLRADEITGTSEIRTVNLADGSVMRLGPRSAVAVSFSGGERRVSLLAGEAFFDVHHDAARPFLVESAGMVTTDVGTRFDLALRGGASVLAVDDGQVRVDVKGSPHGANLGRGEWLRHDGDRIESGSGLPPELTAGPSTRIAARNRPVSEVVDALRPWFGGTIILADAALAGSPVTGVFDASDPRAALTALVGPARGRVVQITPWVLIVTARQ